jgi:hypothetical protein
MGLQLTLHGGFGELLDQRGQDTVFAGEVFALTQGLKGGIHIECRFSHESSLFGSV